jgi:aromatic ring hydroxylase
MGIRTVKEYKESLRDGRRVYIRGEKVDDVTRHPESLPIQWPRDLP